MAAPVALGSRRLLLLDSITQVMPVDGGSIVVSGSHGGRSVVAHARVAPLELVCFNDAGVGKDDAGIAALALLDASGIACVTVSHASARIGDARDAWDHGTISFVNAAAAARGICANVSLQDELRRVYAAGQGASAAPPSNR